MLRMGRMLGVIRVGWVRLRTRLLLRPGLLVLLGTGLRPGLLVLLSPLLRLWPGLLVLLPLSLRPLFRSRLWLDLVIWDHRTHVAARLRLRTGIRTGFGPVRRHRSWPGVVVRSSIVRSGIVVVRPAVVGLRRVRRD